MSSLKLRCILNLFITAILLGSGSSAFSADYYWLTTYSTTLKFSDPTSACDYATRQYAITSSLTWVSGTIYTTYTISNVLKAQCKLVYQTSPGNTGSNQTANNLVVTRYGSGCTAPKVYNSTTQSCELPPEPETDPCEPTIGVEVEHRHRGGEFTGAGVIGGRVDPPGSVCLDQCQYAFSYTAATDAYRFENGDPNGVFLKYKYVGNGVSCVGNEPQFAQPSDSTPSSLQDSECTTKTTDAEGRQTYTCNATDFNVDPGKMDCDVGTVGSVLTCVPNTPSPKMTDKEVEQDITEKTNPDGSKDTTTTTTTTNTSCSGVNSCSTTTSTSTTNQHTNPDGSAGGQSTTCTGSACKDADGQTQEEREEEEAAKSGVTGGQTCEAPPVCKGDAVQCAILKQQYEARCDYEVSQDFDGKKTDIEGLLDGDKFELEESVVNAPSFINETTRFLPASCPPPESISLSSNGGHTFQLSYEPICRVASDFSFLIVAFASLFSALYVGRAFGGE